MLIQLINELRKKTKKTKYRKLWYLIEQGVQVFIQSKKVQNCWTPVPWWIWYQHPVCCGDLKANQMYFCREISQWTYHPITKPSLELSKTFISLSRTFRRLISHGYV